MIMTKKVTVEVPENLYKVLAAEAVLPNMSIEDTVVDDLKILIQSRLDEQSYYYCWVKQAYDNKNADIPAPSPSSSS
jgi:hypothetical protein